MVSTALLAALAGLLSLLSPCVLPLLPVLVASATAEHRLGPAALAIGLALSFTTMGLLVAIAGRGLNIEPETLRFASAVLLVAVGLVLALPILQNRMAAILTPLASVAGHVAHPVSGVTGQFVAGLLLGAVWSPCVGPTLGAATVLAARGEDLATVALTMSAFGLGAGLPLLSFSLIPRQKTVRARSALLRTGKIGKIALGASMIIAGLLVVTRTDRALEAPVLPLLPQWLIALTTRF